MGGDETEIRRHVGIGRTLLCLIFSPFLTGCCRAPGKRHPGQDPAPSSTHRRQEGRHQSRWPSPTGLLTNSILSCVCLLFMLGIDKIALLQQT